MSGRESGGPHRCLWAREKFVCEHEYEKETGMRLLGVKATELRREELVGEGNKTM